MAEHKKLKHISIYDYLLSGITKMDHSIPGHVFLDMEVKELYQKKGCYWTALASKMQRADRHVIYRRM
jgi:hypothetical protein